VNRKINGYRKLAQLFLRPRNYTEERNSSFLHNAFEFLRRFILSNEDDGKIKNYEAFGVLLFILSDTSIPQVLESALELLNTLLKKNWKNTLICLRMQGIHHLASLLVRLSRPLPPDAFTIELISELNEIKEGLKLSQEYRTLLIEKIMESLSLMSFFLGAYNIDCEIVLSEFAASHFLQNDELAFYFMDYLLRMIEIKQNR